MAKISHGALAPSGKVSYSFADEAFALDGRKKYETDNPAVISEAVAHPWLEVEHSPATLVQGDYFEQVRPEDDPLSALNDVSNDPEAARAAEAARRVSDRTAIDAGRDQEKVEHVGAVDVTIAADRQDTPKTEDVS